MQNNLKNNDNIKYIPDIVKNIRKLDPYKIILFGSYVSGEPSRDSDLDIAVILDSGRITQNYDERMKNKLMVRNSIYKLSKKIPIDLIVYTKAEYDVIADHGTSFYHEIERSGKVLYEKTN